MESGFEIPSEEARQLYCDLIWRSDTSTNVRDSVENALSAIRNAQTRNETAQRDDLILEHLPLVTAIAAHIQRSLPVHIELDNLVHAGVMGLFDAATKYQIDKKVAFPAYARHRIRVAIVDTVRHMDWAWRDLRKRYKQVESIARELAAKLNREPTEAEIAHQMGLDSRRWQALMMDFRNLGLTAATEKRGEHDEQPTRETPLSGIPSQHKVLARSELREKLMSAIDTLPEQYQRVVKLYYDRDLTTKEIGNILGLNESRVLQIRKSALERMYAAISGSGTHSAEAALTELASAVFGDSEIAEEWLHEPNLATDNNPPITLLGTEEGFLRVKTLLHRIEYGVLA